MTGPGIEEVAGRYGPACPLRLPDSPVLVEGGGADNRGLVDPRVLVEVVCTAVAGHATLVGRPGTRIIPGPVIGDVVLHQRVRRPSVERQIGGTTGRVEAARVGHSVR